MRPDLLVMQVQGNAGTLAEIRREFPSIPVVAVASASPEFAFEVAKLGATEILTIPLDESEMHSRLEAVIDGLQGRRSGGDTPAGTPFERNAIAREFPNLFSSSPLMAEIRDTIDKVATTSATVLIRGESGVGKEIVARTIFARSDRRLKPFVKVNCAAIPSELLESELFGFEAGAFTGAQRAKPGKFELAHGGTLFLDEIGEMHPGLQAKLLHVLQDGEFSRLGSKRDTAVDVRVLCATNKLLENQVAEGLFREDLFYRINVVTVHIPPLRERRDEIPVLLSYFIEKYSGVYHRRVPPLEEKTVKYLTAYSWPGNIRELENLCKRYVIVGNVTQMVRELSARAPGLSPSPRIPPAEGQLSLLEIGRHAAWQAERQAIREMLLATRWNRKEAARRLKVSYKALLNKIKTIELEDIPRE